MAMVVLLILALILIAGLAAAVVAVVNRNQQRALSRNSQLIPGRPTRVPRTWAVSHDPEAKLHRRLRDAMTAYTPPTLSIRAQHLCYAQAL